MSSFSFLREPRLLDEHRIFALVQHSKAEARTSPVRRECAPGLASYQAVISPARAAVKAAQAAVAREGKASPSSPSAAEARKAIDMVQAALGRRDEAAANLALPVAKSPSATGEKVARGVDVNHFSAVEATATGGELPVGRDLAEVAGAGNGGYAFDEEPTREPESALRTRNNPAASHSPLAHLLW